METPKCLRQRPARIPTPRLSERKKNLFSARCGQKDHRSDSEEENNVSDGVVPLNGGSRRGKNMTNANMPSVEALLQKTPKKAISFLKNNNNSSPERVYDELFEKLPDSPPPKGATENTPPTRRSRRLSLKPKNGSPPINTMMTQTTPGKENIPSTPPRKTYSDELQDLFTNSMNLNKNKKSSGEEEQDEEVIEESSSEDDEDQCRDRFMSVGKKRTHLPSGTNSQNTDAKVRRLNNSERRSISTKSFYSNSKPSVTSQRSPPTAPIVKRSPKSYVYPKSMPTSNSINRGVHHKIKKKPKPKTALPSVPKKDILSIIKNEKLRNLLTSKRQEKDQIESVHRILKAAKNPIAMAKPLSVIVSSNNDANRNSSSSNNNNKDHNDGNNNTSTAITPKRCYMNGFGDISMGFSDIDCSSESEEEEEPIEHALQREVNDLLEEPEERAPTPVPGRKFFKSGHSGTKKEVKITDTIKASVCNGKLSIMPDKKQQRKKKLKLRESRVNAFSTEQAKVDEILKNFDISIIKTQEIEEQEETPASKEFVTIAPPSPIATCSNDGFEEFDEMRMTETEIEYENDDEYHEFRSRLPYNTTNPELIEQQHVLLDFLITNKICTEENFKIFISEPELHKAEAQKIVDQLVVVVSDDPDSYRQRLPYNTTDPAEIEQQRSFLEFLIENNLCDEEHFDTFIVNYKNRQEEVDRIITEVVASTHNISAEDLERELTRFNKQTPEIMDIEIPDQNKEIQKVLEASPEKLFPIFYPGQCQPIMKQTSTRKLTKTWAWGHGSDQYQIDAGQKQFGARQCKTCGLVYTLHEPEEEKLHKEYHSSLHILKFKSWIDEDIVQIYPEWGFDGRILRINENSHVKRQERLKDVLKLVDKELGFYSYIMPSVFVAYFAVRQSQIAGVCLVEPLTKANRYVSINGVDCCTEDSYEAKCGISRIWVSPLHRRFHIASKLVRAVQQHTIFGEEIPLDKIAFSAPTEDGKKFAKSVTKMDNFLVYQ